MRKFLLDTHVLYWWVTGDASLPARMRRPLREARASNPVYISDITLWEIAALVQRGRIELQLPLRDWLERASAPPLVHRVGISPAVAAELVALPDSFPGDPADRIIAAAARAIGATLMTCDERIVESMAVPTF